MPNKQQCLRQIKAVEREHQVMKLAVYHFGETIRTDPTKLPNYIVRRDVETACGLLESTYLIRLFAEFEAGLRQFWASVKETRPGMRDLLEGIAARRRIPFDDLDAAHDVREHRNARVHEGVPTEFSLAECRRSLCIYMSFLPIEW